MHLKEKTISILKQFDIKDKLTDIPVLPKASVLIPLFERGGELHTLFTIRSKTLRSGAGEVCFPGGKRDCSDRDDVDTALREAQEEIGLPRDQVQVVCTLFPIISKEGLLVTGVVGFIDETFCPILNPAEVSGVFNVPLSFFIKKDHYTSRGIVGFHGPLQSFDFLDPDSGSQIRIWGLTAVLATLVAVLAFERKPGFDLGFDSKDLLSFLQNRLRQMISKL